MKSAKNARRQQLRRADAIAQTKDRVMQLERRAASARAELEHRVGLALASDPAPLARPVFVRSSLAGVLNTAQQLGKARSQLKRLGVVGEPASSWLTYTLRGKKVENWHIGASVAMPEASQHDLVDRPLDVWLRGEPLPLPERMLYLLAEYEWPHAAVVAIADEVYRIRRAQQEAAE